MSIEANKRLVQRYWDEVWNQGNLAVLRELFAPALVAGQHYFISRTLQAFADSQVTIDDIIAEDDKVVTRYSWRAVHRAVWEMELAGLSMAVPPTHKAVWDHGIAIFRIADGKLVENWSEWTVLELAQQLGVLPRAAKAEREAHS
jgi:predicted ester cyclase